MPKHPLADEQRHHRSGSYHRIQKLAAQAEFKISRDDSTDAPCYARRQLDGGLMLSRGTKRFGLSRAELAQLVDIAANMPPAQAHIQRHRREPADPPHV